jgi:long-chain acyl-CoA synthetase
MPDRPAIMYKVSGSYRPVLWKDHGHTVELVANGLLSLGINRQDHIAIMSQSRPHWTWADLATLSIGAVTVPVYPTLAGPEALFLFNHSDAVGAFVENERQARKILDTAQAPPKLQFVIVLEGPAPQSQYSVRCITWEELLKLGEAYQAQHADLLPARIEAVSKSDLATIVYTSGTTGVPKGAILLHSNIYGVLHAMSPLVNLKPDDLTLSFLPLSHVYERVGGQFLAIFDGLQMAYAESIESVPQNLMEVRPTVLNGVPRFYEKAYQRIQHEVKNLPKPTQYLIRWAFSLARKANTDGQQDLVRRVMKGELRVADKVVFSRIRQRFGGRMKIMVSGAAPLSEAVQIFFESLGIIMLEGYGLTETTAPVACNTPETNKRGTVGRPLPGIEVKIAEDGEIMVKGPSVFSGYYKNPEATAEALRDGWFLTGDIGEFDDQGYLRIRDRKKDIIITAGGKHVAPQFIENMFRGEQLISNIVVFGDRRKYITALITLNRDGLKYFAKKNQIPFENVDEIVQHVRVRAEIDALVLKKNEELAGFERIKKYTILDGDFTAENDELTPTFKLKRKVIVQRYKSILDGMYDRADLELEDSVSHK